MKRKFFPRGPIQLFALPGTEHYVKKVAEWIISDLRKQMSENNIDIDDYFLMEEEELDTAYSSIDECLLDYLVGDFTYYSHRNGAIEISINKSARRRDIYLFHTFSEADITDRNGKERHITFSDQEVLLYNTLDAFLEAKVNRINIFEMNLGQARSDVPKARGASNLRTYFRNITANGADHLFVFQIHSSKSLIGLDNTRTTYDNLSGQSILKKYILHTHVKTLDYYNEVVLNDWIFSSTDAGGKGFALKFSKSFKTPLLVVDKRRNPFTNAVEEITVLKPESLSIKDKIVYVVDDMIDAAGSIDGVCRKYRELGAKEVNVAAFYGLFSPPAEEVINQLRRDGALNKLIVTDMITHSGEFLKRNPFIEIVDTTYTVARIITRSNQGKSLEKYFLPLNAEQYLKEKVEQNILQKKM